MSAVKSRSSTQPLIRHNYNASDSQFATQSVPRYTLQTPSHCSSRLLALSWNSAGGDGVTYNGLFPTNWWCRPVVTGEISKPGIVGVAISKRYEAFPLAWAPMVGMLRMCCAQGERQDCQNPRKRNHPSDQSFNFLAWQEK